MNFQIPQFHQKTIKDQVTTCSRTGTIVSLYLDTIECFVIVMKVFCYLAAFNGRVNWPYGATTRSIMTLNRLICDTWLNIIECRYAKCF